MNRLITCAALLLGLVISALAQTPVRTEPPTEKELAAAKQKGESDAAEDARVGKLIWSRGPDGPWQVELQEVLKRRGITFAWNWCGTPDATFRSRDPHGFILYQARRSGYEDAMSKAIQLKFGADFSAHANAEAKSIYDKKPKPTPRPNRGLGVPGG